MGSTRDQGREARALVGGDTSAGPSRKSLQGEGTDTHPPLRAWDKTTLVKLRVCNFGSLRLDPVVPLPVERIGIQSEFHCFELGLGDLDPFGVGALVELCPDWP